MKKVLPWVFLLLSFACKKKQTRDEISTHLKKAMTTFLYEPFHNDSSRVKFEVKEVYFFANPNDYDCEFKVRMLQGGHDTTGVMTAKITKDFSKVTRKF